MKGAKIAITGIDGFIGKALVEELDADNEVLKLKGDIRDIKTFDRIFDRIDHSCDYLFHFAAPSSQVLFARNPQYCIETTLKGFMNAADHCRKYGIKLVYPSTGLLSQGKFNEYAMCKKICEDYAKGQESIGIRIFATYGPGEDHKRDFASVPYLFAKDMLKGKSPIVWGNGEQTRDFIYIEDVVNGILEYAENETGVWDLGSGTPTSFNHIIKVINDNLKTPIKAEYIAQPPNYVEETISSSKYQYKVGLADGIRKMVGTLR